MSFSAAQNHVAADEQRGQRLLRGRGRLNAVQADVAAVVETDAARIDRDDAAFALGLEPARARECAVTRDEKDCDDEVKPLRHVTRRGCVARQS
ncbi:hypothetical protein ACVWWP_000842 [Bradyrhizobium sp. LM3.6]